MKERIISIIVILSLFFPTTAILQQKASSKIKRENQHYRLARQYEAAGKYKEAAPYLEELYRRNPTPRTTFELAKLMHRLGREERAKRLLSELETTSPQPAKSGAF